MNFIIKNIIKILKFIFPRQYFRFYYRIKKNYLKIATNGKLEEYRSLWFQISNFEIKEKINDNFFFGSDIDNKKKIRQFVFQNFFYKNLTNNFIFNKKIKLFFPFPSAVIRIFKNNNVNINIFLSKFFWILLVIFCYLRNFFYVFIIIFNFIKYINFPKNKNSNLNHNVSTTNFDGSSVKFKNWLKATCQLEDYNLLASEKDVIFANLNNFRYVDFFIWYLKSITFASYKLIFFFECYYSLIFKELTNAAIIRFSSNTKKTKHFFSWTHNIYKPLWAYESEKKGDEVIMIYQGSFVDIKVKNKQSNLEYSGVRLSTWSHHYVIDEYVSSFIKETFQVPVKTEVKPPIDFFINIKKLKLPKNSIAVFAYENSRAYHEIYNFADYEYSNGHYKQAGRLIFDFYNDLNDLLCKKNFFLVTKRKRNIGINLTKSINNLFNNLKQQPNCLVLDPALINAIEIIDSCCGCIAMPVTSPAIFAKLREIPSIFYDPYNWIEKNDRSLSGVPVYNLKEVEDWLDTLEKRQSL
jgi:hypothetical protein